MSTLRTLSALGLVCSFAVTASACSSKDIAIAGGGVKVQLSQITGTGGDPSKHCTDTGPSGAVSLVDTQADGKDHLLTDGQNGASVKCSIGDTSFNVSVDRSGDGFQANGTVHAAGDGSFISTDATVTIFISTGTYRSDPSAPCTITFDSTYGNGTANATSFACPGLLSGNTIGECSINSGLFSFTNCN